MSFLGIYTIRSGRSLFFTLESVIGLCSTKNKLLILVAWREMGIYCGKIIRMGFEINKRSSWWSVTTGVLFSPQTFFRELEEPSNYRSSVAYLAKTVFAATLINTIILTLLFYVILSSFVSIISAFIAIFGIVLTPLISVAANIPPEKVPEAVASYASNGGLQVAMLSARFGAILLLGQFGSIMICTCLQAGFAHAIARLLGSAGSFRATMSAYSFSSAAWMLSVVPIVNLFAPFYCAVLCTSGMRYAHQVSTGKAALATLLAAAIQVIGFIIIISNLA